MVAAEKRWRKTVSSSRLMKCRTMRAREMVCTVERGVAGPKMEAG